MTMTEIAAVAGVSQATVSRVLNNPELVLPETRRKVLEAIESSHFIQRNNWSRGKNINIGVMLLEDQFCNSGIIIRKYQSIIENMPTNTTAMLIHSGISPDGLRLLIRRQNLRGFLLIGTAETREELLPVLKSIPHHWLNSHRLEDNWMILSGNEAAGRIAADYLIGHNCQRNGVIGVASENPVFEARISSFRYKLFVVGKECTLHTTDQPFINIEKARDDQLDLFLESCITRDQIIACDGLFIPNDRITAHFYRLLQRRDIPRAQWPLIISCNNETQYLAGLYPRPATIDLTPELTAKVGLEQLLREINGVARGKIIDVFVCPELIPGDPVARAER